MSFPGEDGYKELLRKQIFLNTVLRDHFIEFLILLERKP